ncbi:Uncharacterised protein [Streptococcus pneumoniae]|nr:Uncharacterised protein [Streptococcus pneumoniae]CJH80867.1 Uncharacterised protein [Streptococcus pneumoniae]CJJ18261.1 Uncharacterised protein [Streptococcus pneumoniae]CKF55974.1 Uncharacterised protein [Streptococcus pneumoniae]
MLPYDHDKGSLFIRPVSEMKEKSQPLKCVFALSNKVKNNGSRFIIMSSYFSMNDMMRKENGEREDLS